MSLKRRLTEKAFELGFVDIGFTGTQPLEPYLKEIRSRPPEMYDFIRSEAYSLERGASPGEKHPWAESLVVLLRNYYRRHFPPQLTGKIGRCYQVDERKERGAEYRRTKAFIEFMQKEGIRVERDRETPARMSAVRSGVATYGKNCFIYAKRGMLGASWIESVPILIDRKVEPDDAAPELGCPAWCKNACLAACPTGAIYAPLKMNPKKCIAYNSYFSEGITPMELREPMGTWIYGCDRCQEVCPRNQPWMNQALERNVPLTERAEDFSLESLLCMSDDHHKRKVWPLTFYIPLENKAKLQMNAARAMGNLGDPDNIPLLKAVFSQNENETVRGMCAWSLGKLGGSGARTTLEARLQNEQGLVKTEIEFALQNMA
jgi:epoxyqueuosine reductase